MALQHLYSRVPAKISMFNRADSFDTFARSEDLERPFIEKDLSLYCDIRLTQKEATRLRDNGLQPLYYQYMTKTGELVQSCVSFIPQDYTGERSAYLIHSLVLDSEETAKVMSSADKKSFDPALFVKDISRFDITSPTAAPRSDYPTLDYNAESIGSLKELEALNPMTAQRFIYALLACVCGKIKSVYFSLGSDNENVSEDSIVFINQILQILPYHIRPYVSFVSRLGDSTRFTGVKLKSVTDECGAIPAAKGAMISLKSGNFAGFKDEEVGANITLIEFLYSLIGNDILRRDFLMFADNAVKNVPSLGALTLKALGDIVFLYKGSCGNYNEAKVLPNDDKLLDFITVYEKNRNALSEQYRINAMKTLRRYPDNYKEIPRKIFTKIAKMYPTECPCVKLVVMDVVLDLIHTDVMRDKLFTFIKNNYTDESDTVREKINGDLCRVYYGGFLMEPILSFFTEHFPEESDTTKNEIMDKLLLTLRTKSVQDKLLEFIRTNYGSFSAEIKDKLYDAMIENLGDGDELAAALLDIINDNIKSEDESFKNRIAEKLTEAVAKEQKKKHHPMMELIASSGRWTGTLLSGMAFGEAAGSKLFSEYMQNICAGTGENMLKNILCVWQSAGNMQPEQAEHFTQACRQSITENAILGDIAAVMDAGNELHDYLSGLKGEGAEKFSEVFFAELMPIIVGKTAFTVFKYTDDPEKMQALLKYAKKYPIVKEYDGYKPVEAYNAFKSAAENNDCQGSVGPIIELLQKRGMSKPLALYIQDNVAEGNLQQIALSLLKKGIAELNNVYAVAVKPKEAEDGKSSDISAVASATAVMLLQFAAKGYELSEENEAIRALFMPEKSGLRAVLQAYVGEYSRQGLEAISNCLSAMPENEFTAACRDILEGIPLPKESFFGKLFAKK